MAAINGSSGNDTLTGTSGNDTISGFGGNDLILAGSTGGAQRTQTAGDERSRASGTRGLPSDA